MVSHSFVSFWIPLYSGKKIHKYSSKEDYSGINQLRIIFFITVSIFIISFSYLLCWFDRVKRFLKNQIKFLNFYRCNNTFELIICHFHATCNKSSCFSFHYKIHGLYRREVNSRSGCCLIEVSVISETRGASQIHTFLVYRWFIPDVYALEQCPFISFSRSCIFTGLWIDINEIRMTSSSNNDI